jgi:non-canonical poly(A) RNA polymerase PAPD5/7
MVVSGDINPMDNIGILLIEFFELYGKNFNYNDVGIEVTPTTSRYFRRERTSSYNNHFRPSVISIRDPQDPSNDISSGSYNFLRVKFAFQRAYSTLTSMIGAAYEHDLSNAQKRENYVKKFTDLDLERGYMITLLGSILSLSRSVLEQREFLEIQYEKYTRGELEDHGADGFIPPVPAEVKKRKREQTTELVFIADSDSSDEMENLKGKVDVKGHQNKRQRHELDEELFLQEHGSVLDADVQETDGLEYDQPRKSIGILTRKEEA